MHVWVIYVGRHLSWTLKNLHAPVGDGTGDPSISKSSTLPRRYKSRLVLHGSTSVSNTKPIPFDTGWSGDAMVLGKLPVPGRPTNSD